MLLGFLWTFLSSLTFCVAPGFPKAVRITSRYQQSVPSHSWASSVAPSWLSFIYLPKALIPLHSCKKPCIKVSSQFEVTCLMLLDAQALNPGLYQEFPNCLSQSYPAVQNCLDFVWDTELILSAASPVSPTWTVLCVVSLQQSQLI